MGGVEERWGRRRVYYRAHRKAAGRWLVYNTRFSTAGGAIAIARSPVIRARPASQVVIRWIWNGCVLVFPCLVTARDNVLKPLLGSAALGSKYAGQIDSKNLSAAHCPFNAGLIGRRGSARGAFCLERHSPLLIRGQGKGARSCNAGCPEDRL